MQINNVGESESRAWLRSISTHSDKETPVFYGRLCDHLLPFMTRIHRRDGNDATTCIDKRAFAMQRCCVMFSIATGSLW